MFKSPIAPLPRRYENELMDDLSIQDNRIDDALDELHIINKFLGGASTTRKALKAFFKTKQTLSILDVGAGGADLFRNDNYRTTVTAVDINHRACQYIAANDISVVCGNAMMLPFKDKSFDLVHVSLFLHHFTENEIRHMLKSFGRIAKRGIVINDLRRSRFAYWGIKFLTLIFSRSILVKHDGPLSVLRGFSGKEIMSLLKETECPFELRRTWAFRWLAVIHLPDTGER